MWKTTISSMCRHSANAIIPHDKFITKVQRSTWMRLQWFAPYLNHHSQAVKCFHTPPISFQMQIYLIEICWPQHIDQMRYVSKKSALITQLVSLPIEGTKTAVLRRELLSFPSWDEVVVNELRSSLSCVFSDTSSSEDELALTRKSCQQNNILARPTRRNRVMIDSTFNAGQSYGCVYSNEIKNLLQCHQGWRKSRIPGTNWLTMKLNFCSRRNVCQVSLVSQLLLFLDV